MHSTGANNRGFKCPFPNCPRVYASKYNLRRHTAYSHPDFHQFQCHLCLKVLSSKQNYKQHQFIHTGARPFRCDMCEQGFRQSSQLTYHRKEHLKEARLVPVCKVISRQLTSLLSFSSDPHLNPSVHFLWSSSASEAVPLPPLVLNKSQESISVEAQSLGLHMAQA